VITIFQACLFLYLITFQTISGTNNPETTPLVVSEQPRTATQNNEHRSRYTSVKLQLKGAGAAIRMKKYAQAIAILDRALDELGEDYAGDPNKIVDDTETKLMLAKSAEERGNMMRAATLKRNMLSARLMLFRQYYLARTPTP
jgi:hypothetical protein